MMVSTITLQISHHCRRVYYSRFANVHKGYGKVGGTEICTTNFLRARNDSYETPTSQREKPWGDVNLCARAVIRRLVPNENTTGSASIQLLISILCFIVLIKTILSFFRIVHDRNITLLLQCFNCYCLSHGNAFFFKLNSERYWMPDWRRARLHWVNKTFQTAKITKEEFFF